MLEGMSPNGFTDLCRHVLGDLCKVGEDETVAVLSQGDLRQDYADAFLAAAERLGATSFHLRLPKPSPEGDPQKGWTVGVTPLAGNRTAIEALKGADIVIDLVFLLFSKEQLEIQEAGTRMLLCVEPIEKLARMLPTTDQRRRIEAGEQLIAAAREMRITNAAGTDVTYELGDYPVLTEYGYTDTPGRWDHWPSGLVATGGADDGVNGKVVLARGDILITPFGKYVSEPVEFTIEAGRIQDIRGGFDADLLREYIDGFEDERALALSHIGWGVNEKAKWSGLQYDGRGLGMESRCFYGNVLFSTGPNTELGGSNDTPCHIDMPMRNCSLYLDDEPIIVDNEFVPAELKVELPRLLGRQAVGAR